jgi:hypothetical protein
MDIVMFSVVVDLAYAYDLDGVLVHFETLNHCTALLSGNPHITGSCLISSLPKCNMHPINFVSAGERTM